MASLAKTGATPTDWFPDWSAHRCVIVASGPSASTVNLSLANGKAKVIAVNTSWKLCPWADVLYGCDFSWWESQNGVPEFKGLKVSQDPKCPKRFPDVKTINCLRGYDTKAKVIGRRGTIGWGGNSGFQAISLAVQFGCKKLILVGFDMRIDRGLHWHGKHGKFRRKSGDVKVMHNPHAGQVERWRKALDAEAPSLKAAGVTVINCSKVSALRAFPKMEFEAALAA